MRPLRSLALVVVGLSTIGATPSPVRQSIAMLHTRLIKSDPAANDTLAASPAAIRLWYSEKVELPVTKVTLADTRGAAVLLAPLTLGDSAHAPVVAPIATSLPAGAYVVTWRTMASDGHPATGSFGFRVTAAR